jgi:plastocyanin
VLVATIALGACSSGGSGSGVTKTADGGAITVVATDLKFDVKEIKAAPGKLTVTLDNHGAIEHTFKIENTPLLLTTSAGKSATGSATLAKGTYTFECTIPGHAQQGMKGTVVVS